MAASRSARPRIPDAALPWLSVAAVLVLFEILPRIGILASEHVPPISQTISTLFDQLGESSFWKAVWNTLQGWALGLGIAAALAIPIGVVIGSTPLLYRASRGLIEVLRPIPSVALIPLAVLLYGTGARSTLLLVVYASFWQVLMQVLYGVRDVDPVARETARSYRFRPLTRVRTVIWPTALPYVMTGFRLGAAVALILEITGELVIGSPGLGRQIAVAQSSDAVPAMYALVIVVGLIGVIVNVGVRAIERRVLRWHPSVRREVVS
jgi:ABC-type nitrate/sulfonate/bicarbonate transport system permease component